MKDVHLNLAAKFAEHIETNGATSKLTKDGYNATLPEQVTPEVAAILNQHHKDAVPALTIALGERNIQILGDNPSFDTAEGHAELGFTKVQVVTERKGQRIAGAPQPGKPVEKVDVVGLTHVKVTTPGGKAVKDARAHVAQLGADKL